MKKIVVLGSGMVGQAMAVDLARQFQVLAVDKNEQAVSGLSGIKNIETKTADLSQPDVIRQLVASCDIVVGAVPGFIGFETLRNVIEAGKDIIDISFFPENPFELDELAKKKGVVAVVDAGVAPGMSNIILGYHNENMEIREFSCYVGGLPEKREWPFEYKAPFSPIDVIEEYTRPARLMENGHIVTREALSELEILTFKDVGNLEAFNTDGLRTLLHTMKIPNMKEKTLRYPGHIELMRIFRETGLLGHDEVTIGEVNVRPVDLMSTLLFPLWKLEEGEKEFTRMQIHIRGRENGRDAHYQYDLLDRYDEQSGTSSMARTTGYTCTAITRLVLKGHYARRGISPPEYVGAAAGCFHHILSDLQERGIHYQVVTRIQGQDKGISR